MVQHGWSPSLEKTGARRRPWVCMAIATMNSHDTNHEVHVQGRQRACKQSLHSGGLALPAAFTVNAHCAGLGRSACKNSSTNHSCMLLRREYTFTARGCGTCTHLSCIAVGLSSGLVCLPSGQVLW